MLKVFAFFVVAAQAAPAQAPTPAPNAPPPIEDRTFIFNNPALDLIALQTLSPKAPTPAPAPGSNLLPLLVLSGALGGGGGGLFGNRFGGDRYIDEYGNIQDPAKKALLLTQIASGNVSPLTAVAMDRNPGMSTTDTLVAGALGNNALTSLLVLNQPQGVGLTNGGGLFGNTFGNGGLFGGNGGLFGGNGGIFGGNGNNGVLPALVLASAVGGSGDGLGTLLALSALGELDGGSNRAYYPAASTTYYPAASTTYYPTTYTTPTYYQSSSYGGAFGNVGANINNLFG